MTPIGDRDCGAPNDFHYTAAYDGRSVFGTGAFCIYHPQSETVVSALGEVASTASAALDSVHATVGIVAGRTINI